MRTAFPARRALDTCWSNRCWSALRQITSKVSVRTVSQKLVGTGTTPANVRRLFTRLTMVSEARLTAISLPSQARVVIVGGGIAGASVAYHLTRLGWKDVILLEQNKLGGGTTWHAAGLVGRLRTTTSMTKINQASAELYAGLERETGHPVGWKQVGSVIVGKSRERMVQLERTCEMAELMGVEANIIGPDEAQERWPLIRKDDLLGAAWLPHDGKVIPKEVPLALAKAAAQRGASVIEAVRVLNLQQNAGRVTGVVTNQGNI